MRSTTVRTAIFISLISLTGCSTTTVSNNWRADGSISLFRPVPEFTGVSDSGAMLGFVPAPAMRLGSWMKISLATGTIALMDGSKEIASSKVEGVSIAPGSYTLMHKQEDAAWYAPDSYFTSRELEVPAESASDRYLRGALGSRALFLTPETPIHCSPVSTPEVGGARMSEEGLSAIYQSVAIGTPVVVE